MAWHSHDRFGRGISVLVEGEECIERAEIVYICLRKRVSWLEESFSVRAYEFSIFGGSALGSILSRSDEGEDSKVLCL